MCDARASAGAGFIGDPLDTVVGYSIRVSYEGLISLPQKSVSCLQRLTIPFPILGHTQSAKHLQHEQDGFPRSSCMRTPLAGPPIADPQDGWCGEGRLITVPYPIRTRYFYYAFSRRSATHTLIIDCRGTPSLFASLSNK